MKVNKLYIGLAVIAIAALGTYGATRAFFSDTETTKNNTFTAGSLDLKVGIEAPNSQWPSVAPRDNNNAQLFAFNDLMPGDSGSGYFRLVSGEDAWACMSADLTSGSNDLKSHIEVATWAENTADGKVGPTEEGSLTSAPLTTLASGDWTAIQDSAVGNSPLQHGVEYQQGFAYCLGSFKTGAGGVGSQNIILDSNLHPVCDGASVPNSAQGGTVAGTFNFYAEQSANNSSFTCSGLNPTFVLTTPSSQNALNQSSGTGPYFTYTINGNSIDFSLVNPTGHAVYFDYAVDGDTGHTFAESGDTISEGPLVGQLFGNSHNSTLVAAGTTLPVSVTGNSEIKIGVHFGPEQNDYLDWATFTIN